MGSMDQDAWGGWLSFVGENEILLNSFFNNVIYSQ